MKLYVLLSLLVVSALGAKLPGDPNYNQGNQGHNIGEGQLPHPNQGFQFSQGGQNQFDIRSNIGGNVISSNNIDNQHNVEFNSGGSQGAQVGIPLIGSRGNIGSVNLQPSFNNNDDPFAPDLSAYLPPTQAAAPAQCSASYVTTTIYSTHTQAVPTTIYNEQVTTITNVATSTLMMQQTQISTQTVTSTLYNTQFTTFSRTITNTRTQTSQVQNPPQTVFVTSTLTRVSTAFVENTITVTSTNVIPTTIHENQVQTQTQQRFETRHVTNTITQTLPAQTSFQNRFETRTQYVTQTLPAQTVFSTNVIYSTVINTVTSTLPAQTSVIYSTQIVPVVNTVFSTQFVTNTQTQTVERTSVLTQYQTAFSTQYVTNTQYNTQYITQTSERVQTSVVTIPTQIVSNVVSTRVSQVVNTQYVTSTQRQLVTITIPGMNIPVYQTTTVYNPVVSTTYFTNNMFNVITQTQTVSGNCGQATQAGYNYQAPSGNSFSF